MHRHGTRSAHGRPVAEVEGERLQIGPGVRGRHDGAENKGVCGPRGLRRDRQGGCQHGSHVVDEERLGCVVCQNQRAIGQLEEKIGSHRHGRARRVVVGVGVRRAERDQSGGGGLVDGQHRDRAAISPIDVYREDAHAKGTEHLAAEGDRRPLVDVVIETRETQEACTLWYRRHQRRNGGGAHATVVVGHGQYGGVGPRRVQLDRRCEQGGRRGDRGPGLVEDLPQEGVGVSHARIGESGRRREELARKQPGRRAWRDNRRKVPHAQVHDFCDRIDREHVVVVNRQLDLDIVKRRACGADVIDKLERHVERIT